MLEEDSEIEGHCPPESGTRLTLFYTSRGEITMHGL
jgi:hypothetical protein